MDMNNLMPQIVPPWKLERVAAEVHHIWSMWVLHLFSKCWFDENGNCVIPKEYYDRWNRQTRTHYDDLSEDEKKSDRLIARTYIDIYGGI
jgi:hypothetical protein